MLKQRSIALATAALLAGCGQAPSAPPGQARTLAPMNYGAAKPAAAKPFKTTTIATFDMPWALAFLPDQSMLVTEKPGALWLVTPSGVKTRVSGVPTVHFEGQGGLLFVATSPRFEQDRQVYLTYSEPGEGGDGLALAKATLGTISRRSTFGMSILCSLRWTKAGRSR
jgi:glucose/arabinose dehydrogenase